jgi:hypothetical protein
MQFHRSVVVLLTVLAGRGELSANEVVKKFPDYQCQYTLPGKDWTWANPKSDSPYICVAHNGAGLKLMLAVQPVDAGTVIDAKFAEEFDEGTSSAGSLKKRGGRMTVFKGLACYESEWLVNGRSTAAIRVVIANGSEYQLQLLGKADPVEKRPDFEAIMNGFEFTAPAVPPSPKNTTDVANDEKNPAYRTGQALGYVVIALVLVRLAAWVRRRM